MAVMLVNKVLFFLGVVPTPCSELVSGLLTLEENVEHAYLRTHFHRTSGGGR